MQQNDTLEKIERLKDEIDKLKAKNKIRNIQHKENNLKYAKIFEENKMLSYELSEIEALNKELLADNKRMQQKIKSAIEKRQTIIAQRTDIELRNNFLETEIINAKDGAIQEIVAWRDKYNDIASQYHEKVSLISEKEGLVSDLVIKNESLKAEVKILQKCVEELKIKLYCSPNKDNCFEG